MKLSLLLFVIATLGLIDATSAPSAGSRKALIIGLDGTRGDVLYHVVMRSTLGPNLKDLLSRGGQLAECNDHNSLTCAHAHNGFETGKKYEWVTSPGWCSVVTGVNNNKTLVKDNDVASQDVFAETSKKYPSVFARARRAGLVTAASGTPAFLSSVDDDGSYDWGIVDYECGLNYSVSPPVPAVKPFANSSCTLNFRQGLNEDPICDNLTTAFAINLIEQRKADLIMTHYNNIDEAGHHGGFADVGEYMLAISVVDGLIGQMVAAIKKQAQANGEEWLIVLTADHGGHINSDGGGSHSDEWDTDKVVPFLVAVITPQNAVDDFELDTSFRARVLRAKGLGEPFAVKALQVPIFQYDTTPTVLKWLGLPIPDNLDGRPQGI